MQLKDLPAELLWHIIDFLDVASKICFAVVNKKYYGLLGKPVVKAFRDKPKLILWEWDLLQRIAKDRNHVWPCKDCFGFHSDMRLSKPLDFLRFPRCREFRNGIEERYLFLKSGIRFKDIHKAMAMGDMDSLSGRGRAEGLYVEQKMEIRNGCMFTVTAFHIKLQRLTDQPTFIVPMCWHHRLPPQGENSEFWQSHVKDLKTQSTNVKKSQCENCFTAWEEYMDNDRLIFKVTKNFGHCEHPHTEEYQSHVSPGYVFDFRIPSLEKCSIVGRQKLLKGQEIPLIETNNLHIPLVLIRAWERIISKEWKS